MKKIVVISPNKGDGKTSMVEAVLGRKLQWTPSEIKCNQLTDDITVADFQFGSEQFRVFEIPPIKNDIPTSDKDMFDASLIDLMLSADLMIEVQDASGYIRLSKVNDLFDQKVGEEEKSLSEILSKRKMLVYTKTDKESEFITGWMQLTEEQRQEYNRRNKTTGNPKFGTWIEACLHEQAMCEVMYPFEGDYDYDMLFEISAKDSASYQNLREELRKFFNL